MDDPEGKDFPWRPKRFAEIIPGKLVNNKGETMEWSDVKAEVIGIYFSAHWVRGSRCFAGCCFN